MNLGEKGAEDAAADQNATESAAEASTTEPSAAVSASGTADQDGDIVLEDTQAKNEEKPEDTTAAPQAGGEKAEPSGESKESSDLEKKE